jgi:alpha-tubulin suppressor-like RCC1 family protein
VRNAAGTGTLSHVTQISAGGNHTCALLSGGTVVCWGADWAGQLGDGATITPPVPGVRTVSGVWIPVQVKDVVGTGTLSNVTQISARGDHTCALLNDHTIECWGNNYDGQLGNGTTTQSSTPVQVKDVGGTGTLSNVTQISAGGWHTCALLNDHTVECWGAGDSGQLGNGELGDRTTPVSVIGIP